MELNFNDSLPKVTIYNSDSHASKNTETVAPAHADSINRLLGEAMLIQKAEVGKGRPNGATMTTPIEKEGSIKVAAIDSKWQAQPVESNVATRRVSFNLPDDDTTAISMVQRRIPVNQATEDSFRKLLREHSDHAYDLTADEIKSLAQVMNRTTVGDNQYTNPAGPKDRYAPVFHIASCRIEQVKGKPVLQVEGEFVDRSGNATNFYKGIFVEGLGGGIGIHEINFESRSKQSYQQHLPVYSNLLKSIQWKSADY